MQLVDKEELINILYKVYVSNYAPGTRDGETFLGAIDIVKQVPTIETPEKMIAHIKSPIEEKSISKIIEDLLAKHETAKEHEHDYFLANLSDGYYRDESYERSYRYGTLVCRKCGDIKTIRTEK